MLETLVQREPADKRGDDIFNAFLVTVDTHIARGRAEINSNCTNRKLISCSSIAEEFIIPTSVIQVTDSELGEKRGIVDSFSMEFSVSKNQLSIGSSVTYEIEDI